MYHSNAREDGGHEDGRWQEKDALPKSAAVAVADFEQMNVRMQEAGILPLKIRLPKSGTMHSFNRLMTAQEALELNAVFVNLPTVTFPLAGIGLLLLGSFSGLAWLRLFRP